MAMNADGPVVKADELAGRGWMATSPATTRMIDPPFIPG